MSKMKIVNSKWISLGLLLAAVVSISSPSAQAGVRWHGDIRYFHVHDYPVWRQGNWAHRWHNGVYGWYWIVGSSYYAYPRPVYPYPYPYYPPSVVYENQPPVVIQSQPQVVIQPAPPQQLPPPVNNDVQPQMVPPGSVSQNVPPPPAGKTVSLNQPSSTWYHCDKPEGYYPYVATCAGGWNPVPASPPQ